MTDISNDFYWAKQSCSKYRNFKILNDDSLQFSCPLCGDSKYDKKRARGGIYLSPKGIVKYHCFKCGAGPMSLSEFFRLTDMPLYKRYKIDSFTTKKTKPKKEEFVVPTVPLPVIKKKLQNAWDVPECVNYLKSRMVPKRDIKYLPNYVKWANDEGFRKSDFIPSSDPRVVLECRGLENDLIGYIGRTLGESTLRYNNIKLNPSYNNLVFGLNVCLLYTSPSPRDRG